MNPQQLATPTTAPGQPIGYAPVYGATPPPLLSPSEPAPQSTMSAKDKLIERSLFWGLVCFAAGSLVAWGVLDNLYSGTDIRGLERAADAANATAAAADQRAAGAEANAQEWQAHSQQQGETIDGVKRLICK